MNTQPFQVGVTRDALLPGTDRPMADMGLDMLESAGTRWRFLTDDPGYSEEVRPELIATKREDVEMWSWGWTANRYEWGLLQGLIQNGPRD